MSCRPSAVVTLLLVLAVPGCHRPHGGDGASGTGDSLPARVNPQGPDDEARTLYATRCAMCHGPRGAADGPSAAALSPRPRNFRDPAWQANVTDGQIEAIIVRGGQGVGRSAAMPPFPTLSVRPAVLSAMRRLVRSFGP